MQSIPAIGASLDTIPPHNVRFTGRVDELMWLHETFQEQRAHNVCGLAGVGGIGKTDMACAFAHAFAEFYPGGRFLVPCAYGADLHDAVLALGEPFRDRITDTERRHSATHYDAVVRCLHRQLQQRGAILLVLDHVRDAHTGFAEQIEALTALGPHLHVLVTTRTAPPDADTWLTLGELRFDEAQGLLERHRPTADESDRVAAGRIVDRLGGFPLAIELVGAKLAAHPDTTYGAIAESADLDLLENLARDDGIRLCRHDERNPSAMLEQAVSRLDAFQRRALEYASLLPADDLPLPWLHALASRDFPRPASPDPAAAAWRQTAYTLQWLALCWPVDEQDPPRQVGTYRLLQEFIRRGLSAADLGARQRTLNAWLREREAELTAADLTRDGRWELESLDALAALWDDGGHPDAAWLRHRTGIHWSRLMDWTRAEPALRRALVLTEQAHGPEHPDVTSVLDALAAVLQAGNRLGEAMPLLDRALAIEERHYGPTHPSIAALLTRQAEMLHATFRSQEAESPLRRALAVLESRPQDDSAEIAAVLLRLAGVLWEIGRLEEAEPLLRRTMRLHEQALGSEHREVVQDLDSLAQLLRSLNRPGEAEPLLRRVLAVQERTHAADSIPVGLALYNLAALLNDLGCSQEADALFRRAIAIDPGFEPPEDCPICFPENQNSG